MPSRRLLFFRTLPSQISEPFRKSALDYGPPQRKPRSPKFEPQGPNPPGGGGEESRGGTYHFKLPKPTPKLKAEEAGAWTARKSSLPHPKRFEIDGIQ